jgi:hypothetical protein
MHNSHEDGRILYLRLWRLHRYRGDEMECFGVLLEETNQVTVGWLRFLAAVFQRFPAGPVSTMRRSLVDTGVEGKAGGA